MKIRYISSSGSRLLKGHGITGEHTVGGASKKLRDILGSDVYMWCHRRVDAHEALGVLAASLSNAADPQPKDYVAQARARLGVGLTSTQARSHEKLLAALKAADPREAMSITHRYLLPGGYYADHGINPFELGSANPEFVSGRYSKPVSFAGFLLECFDCDEVLVTAKKDVARLGDGSTTHEKNVVDMYFPQLATSEYVDIEPDVAKPSASPVYTTFVSMVGGSVAKIKPVTVDDLMNVFVSSETDEGMPLVRIMGGGIERPVSRVHSSMSEEDMRNVKDVPGLEWLHFHFRGDKGRADLVVYPRGYYRLKVRFGKLEKALGEDVVSYFARCNEVLERVSVFVRPLSEAALRMSCTVLMPKAYYLNTPHIMGGPRSGVYQYTGVSTNRKIDLPSLKRAISGAAGSSLKVVNIRGDELHLLWMRSNMLSVKAVVKNQLAYSPKVTDDMIAEISRETGLGRREVLEISQMPFDKSLVLSAMSIRILSDTKLSVSMKNGNDAEYLQRAASALQELVNATGRAGTSRGRSRLTVSSGANIDTSSAIKIDELDEFYALLEEEGDDAAVGDDGETATEEASPKKTASKADLLGRLQDADPQVFAFPSQPGYVSYSVKCQKSGKKQPLVLSDVELEKAKKGMTKGSREALESALKYRGNTYICPQKWCPTSGVARGMDEPCPDPDEPGWTLWNQYYPALQSGVFHPDGLCLPCCFKLKVKPGSKTHRDTMQCLGNNADSGWKSQHVAKYDKLLDFGTYGYADPNLFPTGTLRADERPVRMGLGEKSKSTFLRAYSETSRTPVREISARLSDMKADHFVQCNVRSFMDKEDCLASSRETERWLRDNPAYRKLMGISRVDGDELTLQKMVMHAHRRAREAVATSVEGVDDMTLYRLINSGAGGLPPVMLVATDMAGNAYVEHVPYRVLESDRVAVVYKRLGIFEPIGMKSKKGFSGIWSTSHPWIESLRDAVERTVPSHDTRLIGRSMMVVGVTSGGGYSALAQPIFIDPSREHARISSDKFRGARMATAEWAARALRDTGDPFYKRDWAVLSKELRANDELDSVIFGCGEVKDKRIEVMEGVADRAEAVGRAAALLSQHIKPDDLQIREKETAKRAIKRIASAYGDKVGKTDRSIVEYAIETILRPVPSGILPTITWSKHERIVSG